MILEIILLLITLCMGYITFNLFRKNETYEDTIELYQKWIEQFDEAVKDTDLKLKEIDNKGTFKSDDEVGFFFNYLQELNKGLADLFEKQGQGEDNG